MSEMPRPAQTATALATVRRQLLDAAAFGTTITAQRVEQVAVTLTEILRGYAETDTRRYPRSRRRLHPRSPLTIHPWGRDRTPRDPEHPAH